MATATWTQFDAMRWWALVPMAIVFAIERWPSWWHRALADSRWWQEVRRRPFPGSPGIGSIAIGAIVCLPLVAHLLATLNEEFPYGGDEGYHFSASRTFALHLVSAAPWLTGLAVVLAVLRRLHVRYLATVALAALWALSWKFAPEMTFARYPAGFYLLAAPLQMMSEIVGVSNPHVANHLVNTMSVPAWLFVLRPILVRRWPDLPALLVGLILFFQPTVVTFFGGGGLEPWSLVLLLVALEASFRLPVADRWVAVLVAGCGAWVKEPAILVLPIVWAIAMVEWRGIMPRPRPGAIPLGIAAATPFFVYYLVRHTLDLPRFYAIVPMDQLFAPARALEWLGRIHLQFGDSGLVLLAALAAAAAGGVIVHRRHQEYARAHALMVLGTIGLLTFFYIDEQGVPYTGYGRYLMFPYVLVASTVALAAWQLFDRGHTRLVTAMAAFVLLCQAQPLARALSLDLAPDYARNSLEWHRCLIRLPFRQLAERIPSLSGGDGVSSVRLVTIALDAQITRVAYPDVARRYPITARDQRPEEVDCRCAENAEAVVAGFEYLANFDARAQADPIIAAAERTCVSQLESTCKTAIFERDPAGAIVGGLGVGVR